MLSLRLVVVLRTESAVSSSALVSGADLTGLEGVWRVRRFLDTGWKSVSESVALVGDATASTDAVFRRVRDATGARAGRDSLRADVRVDLSS